MTEKRKNKLFGLNTDDFIKKFYKIYWASDEIEDGISFLTEYAEANGIEANYVIGLFEKECEKNGLM